MSEEGDLVDLYRVGVDEAVECSENLLCGNDFECFDDFLDFLESTGGTGRCRASSATLHLWGKCKQCGLNDDSCVCLQCFVNGGHKQHGGLLTESDTGTCDCGDNCAWKPSGSCKCHQNLKQDPDLTDLDDKIREHLQIVFTAAISALFDPVIVPDEDQFLCLLEWIDSVANTCAGVRRILAKVVCNDVDASKIVARAQALAVEPAREFCNFIGMLTTDEYFASNFPRIAFPLYVTIIETCLNYTAHQVGFFQIERLAGLNALSMPYYHIFSRYATGPDMPKEMMWREIWMKTLAFQVAIMSARPNLQDYEVICDCLESELGAVLLVQSAAKNEDLHADYGRLLVDTAAVLAQLEGIPCGAQSVLQVCAESDIRYLSVVGEYIQGFVTDFKEFHPGVFQIYVGWCKEYLFGGKFDLFNKQPLYKVSVFAPRTPCTVVCTVCCMAYRTLSLAPDPRATLMAICESEKLDFDEFCMYAALLPLRWFASAYLCSSAAEQDDLVGGFLTFFSEMASHCMKVFFGLVQFYFALSTDKDRFIDMILHVFGYMETSRSLEESERIGVECIFFLVCLISDRVCWNGSDEEMEKHCMIIDQKFRSHVKMRGTEAANDEGVAPLPDNSSWHIVVPYIYRRIWLDLVRAVVRESPDTLLPYPDFEPLGQFEFESVLRSKYLFAVIYDILHASLTTSTIRMYLAGQLLLLCLEVGQPPALDSFPSVSAGTVAELAAVIPSSINDFVRTPVKYKRQFPNTLIEILRKLGPFGREVIRKGNLERPQSACLDPRAVKEQIMAEMKMRIIEFEKSSACKQRHKNICWICSGQLNIARPIGSVESDFVSQAFCYPVHIFSSGIPYYVENKQAISQDPSFTCRPCSLVHGCLHRIHVKCGLDHTSTDSTFQCAICGANRNCLLPIFSNDLSEGAMPLVQRLNQQFIRALSNTSINAPLITVLANHLINLEIRERHRPEAVYSNRTRVIMRSLFLSLAFQMYSTCTEVSSCEQLSGLEAVIGQTLNGLSPKYANGEPLICNWQTLYELAKKLSPRDEKLIIFLRRVLLFGYFMLDLRIGSDDVVDWDQVLSPDSLLERFEIDSEVSYDRPSVFSPLQLPDDWVDLCMPPYSWDIADRSKCRSICLVTGRELVTDKPRLDNREEWQYCTDVWCGAGILCLYLSPSSVATCVQYRSAKLYSGKFYNVWRGTTGEFHQSFLDPSYPTLDRDRLSVIWDDFLSGRIND